MALKHTRHLALFLVILLLNLGATAFDYRWNIFPGTHWCGAGNIAYHPNSLGIYPGVDNCCRAHDLCPVRVEKFSMAYGLFNPRPFPIMHCGCDEAFRSCLKKEGSVKSQMVGQFYFDHLESPCFTFKPGRSCAERTWFGKCVLWSNMKIGERRKPKSF